MTQQSFDDVQIDANDITKLLGNKEDMIIGKVRYLSKTISKITININEFCDLLKVTMLNELMYGEFNPISERKILQTGYYGDFGKMKIYVSKTVKPNHYIAE